MDYECIGVCTPDPLSGLCQGCGRPLLDPVQSETPVDSGLLLVAATEAPCSSS